MKRVYARDRGQLEYVERVFNRVNGTYDEHYYDPVNGDVVYEKHPPITDQSAHGRQNQ